MNLLPEPNLPVLVAEDDATQRRLLEGLLTRAGYRPVLAMDGHEARDLLEAPGGPRLCLLDWNMPGLSGVELCRWIRSRRGMEVTQVLLVTGRDSHEDVMEALDAGANDHVAKPFNRGELLARVASAARTLALQAKLDAKIFELESALAEIHTLRGLLPICAHCHRIRDDAAQWQRLEGYIEAHSDALFSHSVCDECLDRHYPGDAPDPAAQVDP